MDSHRTTVAVQKYLDELAAEAGDTRAEPVVRALLARSVDRLQFLCGALLHRHYARLTRGPGNVQTDELLGSVVERLMRAMRDVRPPTVRRFFALANQHIRWELNDLARRLDKRAETLGVDDSYAAAPEAGDDSVAGPNARRILAAFDQLPDDEREAFDLVRLQGLTKAEAAALLGVSEKTVQRRLSRGLALLTELVGEILPQPPPDARDAPDAGPGGGAEAVRPGAG